MGRNISFKEYSLADLENYFRSRGGSDFSFENHGDIQLLRFDFKGWEIEAEFRPWLEEDGISIQYGFEEFQGETEYLEDASQAEALISKEEWLESGTPEAEAWKKAGKK